jgi:hypothetical protein
MTRKLFWGLTDSLAFCGLFAIFYLSFGALAATTAFACHMIPFAFRDNGFLANKNGRVDPVVVAFRAVVLQFG